MRVVEFQVARICKYIVVICATGPLNVGQFRIECKFCNSPQTGRQEPSIRHRRRQLPAEPNNPAQPARTRGGRISGSSTPELGLGTDRDTRAGGYQGEQESRNFQRKGDPFIPASRSCRLRGAEKLDFSLCSDRLPPYPPITVSR